VLFALDNDNGELLAFAAEAEALGHCKGIDVEDGFWRFYAEDGSPLEARFERPGEPGGATPASIAYTLQRAMSGLWLQERLAQVADVRGCGLASVGELAEVLKNNRGRRAGKAVLSKNNLSRLK
jgi:hypothetical protein